MGIQNKADFTATNRAFTALTDTLFDHSRASARFQLFTDFGQTQSLINRFDVISSFPLLRKWLGPKRFQDLRYNFVDAGVEPYEKSFELGRLEAEAALRDGILMDRIQKGLTTRMEGSYDRLATDFLLANTATGYDGVAVFSASHPYGPSGATQSNISTTALSATQHKAVLLAGSLLADEQGEPLEISYDTLMVPAGLSALARDITGSDRIVPVNSSGVSDATSSVVAAGMLPNAAALQVFDGGTVRVVVNPRMSANKYLYLCTTIPDAKPVIMREYDTRSVSQTSLDSEQRFNRDQYRWSVEADLCIAPGMWQAAYFGNV